MPLFLKKSLIKWTAISLFGVSAYFLGFFWGAEKWADQFAQETALVEAPSSQAVESPSAQLQETREFRHLK